MSSPFQFIIPSTEIQISLPLYGSQVQAGFPSPADDYMEKTIDLNEHLIQHPIATFFVRVDGYSMIEAGIHPGDLLVVDRSLTAQNGQVILAILNGEFTVKRFKKMGEKIYLMPENPRYQPIQITPEHEFEVWGVVTYVIHNPNRNVS